jgi:deazaflavin-dependent oxidoreductase (nitroreductase family)
MAGGSRISFMKPFANHVANPFVRPLAGHLPMFAVITQVGRKSGVIRRNPVNVLKRDDAYIVALTYGSDVNWLKNVVAAEGCRIKTRGKEIQLGPPEVFEDRQARFAPQPARAILRLFGIHEFARMRPVSAAVG